MMQIRNGLLHGEKYNKLFYFVVIKKHRYRAVSFYFFFELLI